MRNPLNQNLIHAKQSRFHLGVYSYQKHFNVFYKKMDLRRPCHVCKFTYVLENCSASRWHRLDAEVSVKLVVLADMFVLAARGFSCLSLNSLRPPAQ